MTPRAFAWSVLSLTCGLAAAPEGRALCPPPAVRTGVIGAGNCVYDIAVNNGSGGGIGGFTIGTGPVHPVTALLGSRQPVGTAGGGALGPYANSFTVRSWTSRSDYLFDTPGLAALSDDGYDCFLSRALPGPITEEITRPDGQIVGVRLTFEVEGRGDDLRVVLEATAQGGTFEDSAAELAATVVNTGGAPASVGLRFLCDATVMGSPAPAIGLVPPEI